MKPFLLSSRHLGHDFPSLDHIKTPLVKVRSKNSARAYGCKTRLSDIGRKHVESGKYPQKGTVQYCVNQRLISIEVVPVFQE